MYNVTYAINLCYSVCKNKCNKCNKYKYKYNKYNM